MTSGRYFFLAFFYWIAILPAHGFDWTLVKENGRDYVLLSDVGRFYNFTKVDLANDQVFLSGATIRMQGANNSRELYLNGLKFILNFPIIKVAEQMLISRMDLAKLVEPVLRPARIQTSPVRNVVLDAGHGGHDQGATGIYGNEKTFSLDVVLRARELLTKAGFNVRLTRSGDVFIPLEARASFASYQGNAIFISVHFNSGFRADAEGIETYCLAPRGVPSTNNVVLTLADFQNCVGNVRDTENIALATAMHASMITRLVVPDRGIKRARFAVLRNTAIPAVLLEGGFLSNPRDMVRIATPAYRQLLAYSILQGVLAYNRAVERSTGTGPAITAEQNRAPTSTVVVPTEPIWDPLHGATIQR